MAYLESRLEELKNNLVAPAKEGGLKALEGQKISEFYGLEIYSVPIFHHSFKNLHLWMSELNRQLVFDIHNSVEKHCIVKLKMLHGNNMKGFENMLEKCVNDVGQKIINHAGNINVTLYFNIEN
jgi:hypothetical protein